MIVIIIVMKSIWQLYDLYTPFLLLVYDMLWLIIASCSIIQPVLYRAMTELRHKQAFKFGCADGASQGSRRGSHVYEINTWLWNFGRPQPRVGGLSVVKTEDICRRARSETSRRAWKTRQARKRAAEEEESTWRDLTFIYHSYTVHISMLIKAWNPRNCVMPPA